MTKTLKIIVFQCFFWVRGSQNRSKIVPESVPELPWRLLAALGASWSSLRRLLALSWRRLAPLGRSWGALGAILPLIRNLANEEREAREKREPQASQATENTRREAQTTARRTRAKHHEAQPSQRGESNASIKIASVVGRVQPLLARCARSPGVWSWNVS